MTYGVQSTDRQKQIGIWIACFLLWVGFVIVSQLEGNALLSAAGFGDEWVYRLLDDFYIPYRYGWIRRILQRLLSALPMILFGMVPMLALAFAALRKKTPALIFAGIHSVNSDSGRAKKLHIEAMSAVNSGDFERGRKLIEMAIQLDPQEEYVRYQEQIDKKEKQSEMRQKRQEFYDAEADEEFDFSIE